MLAAFPVFGFLNYFLRMSNVGMVMHAVTLTREEEPRVRSKLRKLREQAIQHSRELNGSSLLYLGSSHSARPLPHGPAVAGSLTPVAPFVISYLETGAASDSPARRSKMTPNRKGIMNGTAGIPTMKPGLVYHGVERARGSGKCRPRITSNSSATRLMIINARAAPRPIHRACPRATANAAVAK